MAYILGCPPFPVRVTNEGLYKTLGRGYYLRRGTTQHNPQKLTARTCQAAEPPQKGNSSEPISVFQVQTMRFKGWYIGSKNDHSYILPRRVPAGFEHRDEPWMPILDPEGQ